MLKDFRNFVLRGNVVELAVAVVIGAAFGAVITSLVENVLTPLLGVFGTPDFSDLDYDVGKATVQYGVFLNALIAFLMIAAAVFFFIVRPITTLMENRKTETDVESTTKSCPECLSNIPSGARRCAFCTSEVAVSG